MSEAEKKAVSSDPSLELEPVNMYVLFARMFADIARRAKVMGHANDAEHYLSCYDMGRTDYFYSKDDVKSHSVEQVESVRYSSSSVQSIPVMIVLRFVISSMNLS